MEFQYFKLEIFIPETHFYKLQKALQEADAGHIGNYDCCLSYSRVTGTWRPLPGTSPYIGMENEISEEPEFKVEVTCKTENLRQTMEAVKAVHPYEEPVINVIPLYQVDIDLPGFKKDEKEIHCHRGITAPLDRQKNIARSEAG